MAGRGEMASQGGARNPNRVTSGPTRIPDGGGAPAPNNPGIRPLQQPAPTGEAGRPPSAPPLAVPMGPSGPLPNNPRGR